MSMIHIWEDEVVKTQRGDQGDGEGQGEEVIEEEEAGEAGEAMRKELEAGGGHSEMEEEV